MDGDRGRNRGMKEREREREMSSKLAGKISHPDLIWTASLWAPPGAAYRLQHNKHWIIGVRGCVCRHVCVCVCVVISRCWTASLSAGLTCLPADCVADGVFEKTLSFEDICSLTRFRGSQQNGRQSKQLKLRNLPHRVARSLKCLLKSVQLATRSFTADI